MRFRQENKLILLVGGNHFNQLNISELLTDIYHYSVLISNSEEESLSLMEAFQPDLVLFDTIHPSTTGRKFLELKQSDLSIKNIPLIVLTSSPKQIDRITAIDLGAKDCLIHPFGIDSLIKIVQLYL
ncbi:MAG TPA: response regulator [Phormidium sp.]